MEDNMLEDIPIENKEWLREMERSEWNCSCSLAAPAFEVFSVSICPNSFSEGKTSCEVYGEVCIEDEDGTSYQLYCQECGDPETLLPEDNTLSFDMPLNCVVSNRWERMRMSLKQQADDAVIIEHAFGLDTVTQNHDYYDHVRVQQVHGVGGSARVSYGALQTAVLVLLKIELIKKVDSGAVGDLPAAHVFRRITARYGNTYGKRFPGNVLFKRQPNQFAVAESRHTVELSRDLVAVPAYSFLRIEVELSNSLTNRPIVNGKADFLGQSCSFSHVDIHGEDFLVRVNVKWFHPYAVEKHIEQQLKRRKVHIDQPPRPSLSIGSEPFQRKHKSMGFCLVEVFTVMIGYNSRSELSLYGTFVIRDNSVKYHHRVFDRDEKNPETLSGNRKAISIEGPCESLIGPQGFVLDLDLTDVQGHVAIRGTTVWDSSSIKSPISWYDKRLCSVIRGIHGYGAVHYTIFSRAVQALVKVSFISRGSPDVSHRVHGNIIGILFNEPLERCLELRSGCTIRLLKYVVILPSNASLIVDVDLHASSSLNGIPGEHFKDVVEFKIDPDASVSPAAFGGKNCHFEVSVEWSKLFKLYGPPGT